MIALRHVGIRRVIAAAVVALAVPAGAAPLADATAGGVFGLYPATDFRLATGASCVPCATIRQARWYFRDETIAVPRDGLPVAGYTPGVTAFEDVRAWAASRSADAALGLPPLVWVAAPQVARRARLAPDGNALDVDGVTRVELTRGSGTSAVRCIRSACRPRASRMTSLSPSGKSNSSTSHSARVAALPDFGKSTSWQARPGYSFITTRPKPHSAV